MLYKYKNDDYEITVDDNKNANVNVKNKNMSLFRYRTVNKYTMKQLLNSSISFSKPSTFDDPFDCRMNVDCEKFASRSKIKVLDKEGKEVSGKEACELLTNKLRNESLMACFTHNNKNQLMWSMYGDRGKGFILEYSLSELNELYKKIMDDLVSEHLNEASEEIKQRFKKNIGLFTPTFYMDQTEELHDNLLHLLSFEYKKGLLTSIDYKKRMNILLNLLKDEKYTDEKYRMFFNGLIFKKKEWKTQVEWRMCFLLDFGTPHMELNSLKPKGIYLGEYIDKESRKTILEYCHKNSIAAYVAVKKFFNNVYTYDYIKIKEPMI